MSPELHEYLEQEYSEFEAAHFQGERFWRAPVSELKGTVLFPVFEQLCASFPDHPSEHNTLFYLVESASGAQSVLLVCTHFEHASIEDVRGLVDLFEQHAAFIVRDGSTELIALELLDHSGEELRVRFYEPVPEVACSLQEHATRASA